MHGADALCKGLHGGNVQGGQLHGTPRVPVRVQNQDSCCSGESQPQASHLQHHVASSADLRLLRHEQAGAWVQDPRTCLLEPHLAGEQEDLDLAPGGLKLLHTGLQQLRLSSSQSAAVSTAG